MYFVLMMHWSLFPALLLVAAVVAREDCPNAECLDTCAGEQCARFINADRRENPCHWSVHTKLLLERPECAVLLKGAVIKCVQGHVSVLKKSGLPLIAQEISHGPCVGSTSRLGVLFPLLQPTAVRYHADQACSAERDAQERE